MLRYTFFSQPSPLWADVLALRMQVFVQEMDVPSELEQDHYDATALHLSVQDGDRTIGTLRLMVADQVTTKATQECAVKIGRFAVHKAYRRQGVGTHMMQQVFHWCHQQSITHICLNAQTYIIPFYQSLGFIEQGNVFMDAGIPHVRMERYLTSIKNKNG